MKDIVPAIGEEDGDLAAVQALERRRALAVANGDADAIAEMLVHDFIQVHASGRIDDREATVAGVLATRRLMRPRRPNVRISGDIAVLTGPAVLKTATMPATRFFLTQVAVRGPDGWRFSSIQVTRLD